MSAAGKYRSFAITFRPKLGIIKGGALEKKLISYFSKFEYASYIFEKEAEARHFHGQLWLPELKTKGDIKKQMLRFGESCIVDWDLAQKKVAICVCICYNSWFDNYCLENELKLDEHSDTCSHRPPLIEDEYYPTEEEQDAVKKKANAVDQRFHSYKVLWEERFDYVPTDLMPVANFLHDLMFIEKLIPVVIDKKARINICECLYFYLQDTRSVDAVLLGAATFLSKEKEESALNILKAQQQIEWVQN